jgi:hypothetical protein
MQCTTAYVACQQFKRAATTNGAATPQFTMSTQCATVTAIALHQRVCKDEKLRQGSSAHVKAARSLTSVRVEALQQHLRYSVPACLSATTA